ncbi:MAG: FtsH protease activity modulator HflK [Betaproteobacteria bacterium]
MALNDPQWGKRRGEGPPDLDEIWARFNQKLSGMFGGKGRDPGTNGSGGGGTRQFSNGPLLLVGLVIAVWIASGFYIVDAASKGVVFRFGKVVEMTDPGPRWHFPYPIESAEVVNVSGVRTIEVGYRNDVRSKLPKESLMLTDDENIVDVQFAVQYVLKDAEAYLLKTRNPEDSVRQVAESAIREIVGKSKMDRVLYEGRAEITASARKLMQEVLDRYQTGISINQVTMQNAQPPEQVQAAFADAVKAGQDRERQKNEGEAYFNDVVPKAEGTAARLREEADGYRQRVIATSEGEASRFKQILTEYSKAPGVTRDRLYLDMMQQVLSNTSKVFIDQKAGSNLLYLPLDKIIQATGAGGIAGVIEQGAAKPQTSGEQPGSPQQSSEPTVARSRDAFRSREREARP